MDKTTESWMWADGQGGVQGATIDLDEQHVSWFDQPGCACAGSDAEQSLSDFLKDGPRYSVPPADILAEMRAMAQGSREPIS